MAACRLAFARAFAFALALALAFAFALADAAARTENVPVTVGPLPRVLNAYTCTRHVPAAMGNDTMRAVVVAQAP